MRQQETPISNYSKPPHAKCPIEPRCLFDKPTASKHTKLTCLLPKRTLASLSNIELFFIGQFERYNFEDLLYFFNFFEWIEDLLYRLDISPNPQDHTHSMIEPSFEGLVIHLNSPSASAKVKPLQMTLRFCHR